MLERILTNELLLEISKIVKIEMLTEIRIRRGLRVSIHDGKRWQKINYTASQDDIDYVVGMASNHSLYSINDCVVGGYIPCLGGMRIGIAGEGVREGDKLCTVKDIAYIAIRQPRQIKGLTDKLKYNFDEAKSFLIISPPGGGKTTLIREMIKKISDGGSNCMILDERMEISGISGGERYFDVGENTDIASNIPKTHCMESIIRSMRPDFIFTDEIFKEEESASLLDALRCGIKIGATIHGRDTVHIKSDKRYSTLLAAVNYVIVLTDSPIGKIVFEGNHNLAGV